MSAIPTAVEQLNRIHKGPAWHGASLLEALSGLSSEDAGRKSGPGSHSIWDLVHHISAWENVFGLRLKGQPVDEPDEGDFPVKTAASSTEWAELIARLDDTHQQLIDTISSIEDSNLEELVAGEVYSKGFLIDGSILHHVYHTGQIIFLRRTLGI